MVNYGELRESLSVSSDFAEDYGLVSATRDHL